MNHTLFMIIMSSISIIIFIGAAFFINKAQKNRRIIGLLRNEKILFLFLILWTIFGFYTQQDFTWSCDGKNFSSYLFSFDNIICSSISGFLLLLGLLIYHKFVRNAIVILELTYWIVKLYALKSGYEGVAPVVFIAKYYDFIGLLARLLLLNALLKYRFKEYILVLFSGLVLILKVLAFPCNENFIERDYIIPYKNQLIFNQINGSWTGSMLYPKDSTISETIRNPDTLIYGSIPEVNLHRDTTIFLRFENAFVYFNDSSLTIKKTTLEFNGDYHLTYSQPESGFLVYIPNKYIEDVKKDYRFNQYSISVILGHVSDSTLSFTIDPRTKLKLKKSR